MKKEGYPNFDSAIEKIGWAIIILLILAFIATVAGFAYLIYIFATMGFS
jgi:hypothetical protein